MEWGEPDNSSVIYDQRPGSGSDNRTAVTGPREPCVGERYVRGQVTFRCVQKGES